MVPADKQAGSGFFFHFPPREQLDLVFFRIQKPNAMLFIELIAGVAKFWIFMCKAIFFLYV